MEEIQKERIEGMKKKMAAYEAKMKSHIEQQNLIDQKVTDSKVDQS